MKIIRIHRCLGVPTVYPYEECAYINALLRKEEDLSDDELTNLALIFARLGEETREDFAVLLVLIGYTDAFAQAKYCWAVDKQRVSLKPVVTYAQLKELSPEYTDATAQPGPVGYLRALHSKKLTALLGFDEGDKLPNYNLAAKLILKHYRIAMMGSLIYIYEDGVWHETSQEAVEKGIYRMIDSLQKNNCRPHWVIVIFKMLKLNAEQIKEFETDDTLINMANGVFDTQSFQLYEHQPEFYFLSKLPIRYDENAQCPIFIQTIREIACHDVKWVLVMQEIFGYCLSGHLEVAKFFIFYGAGANGKSLLIDILIQLCGEENVSSISLKELSEDFHLDGLVGKKLNAASENEFRARGSTQKLKAITTGDKVSVERKYCRPQSMRLKAKLVFATNNLPIFDDSSDGFFRRLFIVPFSASFVGKDEDKQLKDKLVPELPGIFNWALDGLTRLRENNFVLTRCKAVENCMLDYRSGVLTVEHFVVEALEACEGNRIDRRALRSAYHDWLLRNGCDEDGRTSQRFWRDFRDSAQKAGLAIQEVKVKGERLIKGVRLRNVGGQFQD